MMYLLASIRNLSERFWLLSKEVIELLVRGNSTKGELKETPASLTNLKLLLSALEVLC